MTKTEITTSAQAVNVYDFLVKNDTNPLGGTIASVRMINGMIRLTVIGGYSRLYTKDETVIVKR